MQKWGLERFVFIPLDPKQHRRWSAGEGGGEFGSKGTPWAGLHIGTSPCPGASLHPCQFSSPPYTASYLQQKAIELHVFSKSSKKKKHISKNSA